MKRIALFLFLSTVALSFSACKKEYITQQVDQAFSRVYPINGSDWGSSDGGYTYSTTLSVPEIDNIVVGQGGVIVYLSFDNGATFEAVPEVYQNISYGAVHSGGSVTIDIYDVEGNQITPPSGQILAKVVIVDADPL